jgi:hypothetical protein
MAKKGSKYARKHQPMLEAGASAQKKAPPIDEENSDIAEALCSGDRFLEKFRQLPYGRQIETVGLLYSFCKKNRTSLSKDERSFLNEAERHLLEINCSMGTSFDEGSFYPLSDDEKRLVRMECYGSINRRLPHQLSDFYKFFTRKENLGIYRLKDYDLSVSPSWRIFNQFESFRSIAPRIRRSLHYRGINPDALKVMTVSDFCDAIFQHFKKDNQSECAYFLEKDKALKNRIVMEFMRKCGRQFENRLIELGNDPRCAASLCNKMRRFGVCDVNSLIVTETHYTPEILHNLEQAGYNIENRKVGMPIPIGFVNKLIDRDQARLIEARCADGRAPDKSMLPQIEDHHKYPVKLAANGGYLAAVNYPNNHMLVDSSLHMNYYHLFDNVAKQKNAQQYYSRLNINNRFICMSLGFQPEDSMICDFENTKAFQQRKQQDMRCSVNYAEMMTERLQNEQEIADKYAIPYTKRGVANSIRSIKELTDSQECNKKQMAILKRWLNSQRKGRK